MRREEVTYVVDSIVPHKGKVKISITVLRPWFLKLFGMKDRKREFWGSGTVWYELPSMKFMGTLWTGSLLRVWTKWNYECMDE